MGELWNWTRATSTTVYMTPTARTLANLRAMGWLVAVTEHWVPVAKVRRDLFGFIDIIAIAGAVTLAVQATSRTNVSHRVQKILAHKDALAIAKVWDLEVWGWAQISKTGRWQARRVAIKIYHHTDSRSPTTHIHRSTVANLGPPDLGLYSYELPPIP